MGTPALNLARRPSLEIVKDLIDTKSKLIPLDAEYEALKVELRTYGAKSYATDKGTVVVGEPEVRKFKGRILTVNQDAALRLSEQDMDNLIALGVLVWEDQYTRNAVAKVETTPA